MWRTNELPGVYTLATLTVHTWLPSHRPDRGPRLQPGFVSSSALCSRAEHQGSASLAEGSLRARVNRDKGDSLVRPECCVPMARAAFRLLSLASPAHAESQWGGATAGKEEGAARVLTAALSARSRPCLLCADGFE